MAVARVPDVSCPKCGNDNVYLKYCHDYLSIVRPWHMDGNTDDKCTRTDPPHFHRRCGRCDFRWRTDDVLVPNETVAVSITSEAQELLASIWLYVKWFWVTKQLTTEQKELWADAVDAHCAAGQREDGEPVRAVADRWWRDA